eukprot:scaffold9124_cov101-Isochrysis_galbana.AAC.9
MDESACAACRLRGGRPTREKSPRAHSPGWGQPGLCRSRWQAVDWLPPGRPGEHGRPPDQRRLFASHVAGGNRPRQRRHGRGLLR